MAQKIQFIVAIIADPDLIILDEPFSGLDPVNLDLLREVVLELNAKGTTVIFSTHDMEVAQRLCDRVFMIYNGKKVLDGTIDAIREDYGVCAVRVRMADGKTVPKNLRGVTSIQTQASFTELQLESRDVRSGVLGELMQVGDVSHFETVQPTLHDIFVRIAKPTDDVSQSGETWDE
jgi:ABC-2 type transport system ATP-binding protein